MRLLRSRFAFNFYARRYIKVRDDDGVAVGCVFALNLKPGVVYQLHVYGRAVQVDGIKIRVESAYGHSA
jgi:hypothetical protein